MEQTCRGRKSVWSGQPRQNSEHGGDGVGHGHAGQVEGLDAAVVSPTLHTSSRIICHESLSFNQGPMLSCLKLILPKSWVKK
jgi:hypothetical protein